MTTGIRIAVSTDDGATVAPHMGHCASFLIYELAGEEFTPVETRANAHAAKDGGHVHGIAAAGSARNGHHHNDLVDSVKDCQVVVAAAIGRPAMADLERHGIRVVAAPPACQADLAVRLFLSGALQAPGSYVCHCGSH